MPGYTPSRTITTVEHTRTANRSADTILKFRSHAFCPDSIPVLLSRQRITGSVELSLKKKTTLKSVVVKVRGYRISPFTRAREEKTFVEASTVLWPDKNGAKTVRQGIYSWKFSLSLPPTTTSLSKEGSAIALPPSFSDTQSTEYIKYELVLLVDKGMFSVDSG